MSIPVKVEFVLKTGFEEINTKYILESNREERQSVELAKESTGC